mmetsp:Transcript_7153/g.10277  ORF Transcript_7153/g.10277 Transcript_7153/m.10277 type:complete len:343 (-) Transcript_7153:187-1215(-)|eukprot:CAMPEP_0206472684 /NCGR_PEP_ID=MMETSP0324_2-20121206/32367_1 /ASSEMBLY_ACC=CAM_ASM_000836 /TAXON_ID=2866 /ORGANISM="Crypthecodinium cohnii, Strain Seligo" /LENGTH=342 /DNA_ID=CAMNT_0053947371 /DNA_START=109 /DNA_END=1137 /DNA_ORIENTATION=-
MAAAAGRASLSESRRRGHGRSLIAAIWALGLSSTCAADQQDTVAQDLTYIWPTTLWQVPLFPPEEPDSKDLTAKLAKIAEEGFAKFKKEALPKMLELDNPFRAHYEAADVTMRDSEAFLRWQRMSFAMRTRVPLGDVDWVGPQPPKMKGVSFDWPELHSHPDFKRLSKNFEYQCDKYVQHVSKRSFRKEKPRLFVWAEVLRPGDYDLPHVHTGALAAGLLAATSNGGSEELSDLEQQGIEKGHSSRRQLLTFKDPRGPVAPFGNHHYIGLEEGELAVFPSWLSHYFGPNPGNETNVYFHFLMWPRGGPMEMDWEDDPAGDYLYKKKTGVKRGNPLPAERTEL